MRSDGKQMINSFIQRGGFWVAGQFTILLAIAVLGLACRSASRWFPGILCGLIFLIGSAVCGIAGTMALGRNLTPFPKPLPQTHLVQHGIYNWMRHPLYTAVICAALGWSLVQSSWQALAASLVLTVFLDAKARHEEHLLQQEFPGYGDYQQRVRRFIPWVY